MWILTKLSYIWSQASGSAIWKSTKVSHSCILNPHRRKKIIPRLARGESGAAPAAPQRCAMLAAPGRCSTTLNAFFALRFPPARPAGITRHIISRMDPEPCSKRCDRSSVNTLLTRALPDSFLVLFIGHCCEIPLKGQFVSLFYSKVSNRIMY